MDSNPGKGEFKALLPTGEAPSIAKINLPRPRPAHLPPDLAAPARGAGFALIALDPATRRALLAHPRARAVARSLRDSGLIAPALYRDLARMLDGCP